jgi:hypothetical protein
VPAAFAPDNEPHLGGERLAQRHRRRLALASVPPHNAPMPPLDLTDDEHATKQKHGTPPMTTPQWVAAGIAMVLLSLVVVSCEASIWHECRTAGHSWLYCARIFVK